MSAQHLQASRFVRKTQLAPGEYRKNFRQIDADIIAAVASVEADRVTPLMSKIYLRLVSAPAEFWERESVLYFAARETDGGLVKASKALYEVLGVASATAHKALRWMHGQGIIGYFAGKNGAGIRIFLNRAASSIGSREVTAGKKILPFTAGSTGARRGSSVEPAFNDSFADPEVLDSDFDPRAPQNGAADFSTRCDEGKTASATSGPVDTPSVHRISHDTARRFVGDEVIERLARELAPHVRSAAAAEHERTRDWFDRHALPKAIRIAQRSAYDVLRAHGVVTGGRGGVRVAGLDVGRRVEPPASDEPLTDADVTMLAESCVALLETQRRPVESTLAEMGVGAGGFLRPEDAPRVRAAAESLMRRRDEQTRRGGGE